MLPILESEGDTLSKKIGRNIILSLEMGAKLKIEGNPLI